MIRTVFAVALAAAFTVAAVWPQEAASPEALTPSIDAERPSTASPESAAQPSSPERTHGPDLSQVNFRLLRVVSESEYSSNPNAYQRLEARTPEGGQMGIPVDPTPLMHVTELERAVIRQDRYGLHHLDVYFKPEDATTYGNITASRVGQRVMWTSRDSILADLFITQRANEGGFSIFYGDSPVERIENVLRILQVPHTREVAEDLFVPESVADEHRLAAMRAIELQRHDEAIQELFASLAEGGPSYAERPRVWFVLGGLYQQRADFDNALAAYQQIRSQHPDFADLISVLEAMRDIKLEQGQIQDAVALNREIVQRTDGRGLDAIEAQHQIVSLMWSSSPPSTDAERETQRYAQMLQEHIASLSIEERFPFELELIYASARTGDRETALRAARSRLENLASDPTQAAVQVLSMCEKLRAGNQIGDALQLLDEYMREFQEQHDVTSADIAPLWEQIETAKSRLEQSAASVPTTAAAAP